MKALGCICDEMLEKMKHGPSYSRSDKQMALSWECPTHGKVTADYRHVENVHPEPVMPYGIRRPPAIPSKKNQPGRIIQAGAR
jgi:hypothetical protein